MLSYLSKFVLQMLPTISATVIGAYIVATWINPKAPPEQAKIAARSPQQAAKAAPRPSSPLRRLLRLTPPKPSRSSLLEAKPAEAKPVEAKPVETAETPKPAKAASAPDKIRIIPIVKQPAQTTETSVGLDCASRCAGAGRGCRRAEGCQRTGPCGDPAPARRHGDGARDG